MKEFALTRTSTIGPLAGLVRASGASIARVFRLADLPPALVDYPDRPILLADQCRLVDIATRETGDEAFPARLAAAAGLDGFGPYGHHIESFGNLRAAITTAFEEYASLLQACTRMELTIDGRWARWSYLVAAPIATGRQKNELLAIGYMLTILRRFAGARWIPDRVEVPGMLDGQRKFEDLYACGVRRGSRAALVFPAELLELSHAHPQTLPVPTAVELPAPNEFGAVVEHMIRLGLLSGRIGIDRTAHRLGLTKRTFQRRLRASGNTYECLSQRVILAAACDLLRRRGVPITEIAYELGYTDAAHFSRAFHRWTGDAPRTWRRRQPADA